MPTDTKAYHGDGLSPVSDAVSQVLDFLLGFAQFRICIGQLLLGCRACCRVTCCIHGN